MRFPFDSVAHGSSAPPAPNAVREAGELFNKIRLMAGMTLTDLAARLHTTPSVILALETGDVRRLPPWSETVVIVSGFTALAGVDPRPVLGALAPALGVAMPAVPRLQTLTMPKATARSTHAGPTSKIKPQAVSAANRLLGKLPSLNMPRLSTKLPKAALARLQQKSMRIGAAIVLSLVLLTSYGSVSVLQAAASSLPQPLSGAFRKVEDYWLRTTARDENGFLWIEVSDPRSRKTGKLPAPRG